MAGVQGVAQSSQASSHHEAQGGHAPTSGQQHVDKAGGAHKGGDGNHVGGGPTPQKDHVGGGPGANAGANIPFNVHAATPAQQAVMEKYDKAITDWVEKQGNTEMAQQVGNEMRACIMAEGGENPLGPQDPKKNGTPAENYSPFNANAWAIDKWGGGDAKSMNGSVDRAVGIMGKAAMNAAEEGQSLQFWRDHRGGKEQVKLDNFAEGILSVANSPNLQAIIAAKQRASVDAEYSGPSG